MPLSYGGTIRITHLKVLFYHILCYHSSIVNNAASNIKTKLLYLFIILTASAFAFGYTLFLFNNNITIQTFIYLLVAVNIFLALFILQSLFIKNFKLMAGLCAAETLAILIPFYKNLTLLLGGAAIFTFIIFLNAAWQGRKEIRNMLKINFIALGGRVIAKATVAIIIFGIVVYLGSITFQDIVRLFLATSETVIQNVVTQFFPLASGDLSAQVQNLLLQRLQELPENIKRLSIVGFALLVFFSIRAGFFLINWVVVLLSYGAFKLLVLFKFANIGLEESAKEIIEL